MDPNFRNQAFGSPQRRLEFFEAHPQMYGFMPVQMFYHPMVPPQQPHPHQQLMFMNPYGFQTSAIKAPSPRNHPLNRFVGTFPQQSSSQAQEVQLPERHQQALDLNLSLPVSKLLDRDYAAISEYTYSGNQIGAYDVASRRARIEKYRQKRKELSFKQVRYQSRASICQKRERVGGRFVKTSEVIRADAATKRQRRTDKQKLERVGNKTRSRAEGSSESSSVKDHASSSGPSSDEEEEEEERGAGLEVSQVVQSILKLKSRQ